MHPEGFGEIPGLDESAFSRPEKPIEPKKKQSPGMSRRDLLKGAGGVAATEASYFALSRGWKAFVGKPADSEARMGEQDFEQVVDFDRQLQEEIKTQMRSLGVEEKRKDAEAVIGSVQQTVKHGIEKVLPAVEARYRQIPTDSGEKFGQRVMGMGMLGALTVPAVQRLLEISPSVRQALGNEPENRRNFLFSLLGTAGATGGAATTVLERRKAGKSVETKNYKKAIEEKTSNAALLLADRVAGGAEKHPSTQEDQARAEEYEQVVRIAISPNNKFNNSKILENCLERFGAAYYLREVIARTLHGKK